jgi:hypothetical protein
MLIIPENKFLFGKPEIKKKFARTRYMWEYNIKIDPTKTGRDGVN